MMEFHPPVTLEGRYIRLVPLDRSQVPALACAGAEPTIWTYIRAGDRSRPERMAGMVEELLAKQAAGIDLPFTTLLRPSEVPVGMTRYLDIDRPDRNVEVGGTWLRPELWRSPVNTESKLLMFSHAFDDEGCERVQIKTDVLNVRSQRAIERLGAVREGVLRRHILRPDGRFRDSVVYSVLRSEWPTVKARLLGFLERPWQPPERTAEWATVPSRVPAERA